MDRLPAWVEVDLDAFEWNLERIAELASGRPDILLVVKADAYGHGAVRISRFAAEKGVAMLGVATLDEGRELRNASITAPILILSPVLPEQMDDVLESGLAVTASSVEFARAASEAVLRNGKRCTMHIEVDTGMGRTGLGLDEALGSIVEIAGMNGLDIEGIFTHFPSSDGDFDYTRVQLRVFNGLLGELAGRGIRFRYVHSANSAAIVNFPSSHFNLIRPGLLAYGHYPSIDLRDKIDLAPVLKFKSRLILVRKIGAGRSVSYGRTFIAPREMTVGVIAAGYGHGMSHRLSNNGMVLFRGGRAPIIGRVTMDMTMIDVSAWPDAAVGEEVTLIGSQGENEISVDDIAQWDGTLNYEVLCRISKRVVRAYIRSGRLDSFKSLLGAYKA
ncbi:MAG: alanine racemase [Candidatus Krumholzibacteria bacterium]|jgi:alanine racemase|nr:alanine racemase [Candidatus Krumholzibacteria bacterium]